MDDEGIRHLIRMMGLCQTPRESWSEHDNQALREAREYVQNYRKESGESKSSETGSGAVEEGAGEEGAPSSGGVRPEGVPLEEGDQAVDEPDE